jgi:PIN domain nuclease of toxin-antitoxin system
LIVLDTHALVWLVEADPSMGQTARNRIQAAADADGVLVSAITVWEIGLLTARQRLGLGQDIRAWTEEVLALPGIVYEPLTPDVAINCHRLPGNFHKDPADRVLVATARLHGIPLVTADGQILDYAKSGHVQVIDASL